MRNDVVATITGMSDGGQGGAYQIRVRSSAMRSDQMIRVSREEYAQLTTGMLVTVFMFGWGPLTTWRLRRDELKELGYQ